MSPVAAVQGGTAAGMVGFISSTDWQQPEPWLPPAPLLAAPFQWRFTNVSVTCDPGGTAMLRMAALPRPAGPPLAAQAQQGQYCYSVADRGELYRGDMAFSESGRPCVPWGTVTQPGGANALSAQYLPSSCDTATPLSGFCAMAYCVCCMREAIPFVLDTWLSRVHHVLFVLAKNHLVLPGAAVCGGRAALCWKAHSLRGFPDSEFVQNHCRSRHKLMRNGACAFPLECDAPPARGTC